MKWEYSLLRAAHGPEGGSMVLIGPDGKRIKFAGGELEELSHTLNQLGAEGWEVVGYGTFQSASGTTRETWTLKRPK